MPDAAEVSGLAEGIAPMTSDLPGEFGISVWVAVKLLNQSVHFVPGPVKRAAA